MISSFDKQNLDKLLKDFYTALNIRISIFDDNFQLVTEYPVTAPVFCQLIRRSEEGRNACRACDDEACKRAKALGKPHVYTCHAGINEAITPIMIGGGVVGYAILAHMLPEENYGDAVDNACRLATDYGVLEKDARDAIKEIVPRSTEQIKAAAKLLDAVSSYVYIRNLATWKNEDISYGIDKYVKKNLHLNLTAEEICRQFNCSRSHLYNVSYKNFNMGIMQYVNKCRIDKAKKLLKEGKSIAEVATECGFSEYNYFCKVFRKHVGLSPSKFRELN